LPQDDHHGDHGGNVEREHILCVIPPVLTAAGCIALFFFADPLYQLLLPIVGGG
jgi:multicomponent Na+:H+ antiporter subunit D